MSNGGGFQSLLYISLSTTSCKVSHPCDIACPLSHTDRLSCIEEIKKVGCLKEVIIRRQDQPLPDQRRRLFLIHTETGREHSHIRLFKVVARKLDLGRVVDIAIFDPLCPCEVKHIIHPLKIHGDPLKSVCQFHRYRIEFYPPDLLEIGKLGNLHPIQPDLPTQ